MPYSTGYIGSVIASGRRSSARSMVNSSAPATAATAKVTTSAQVWPSDRCTGSAEGGEPDVQVTPVPGGVGLGQTLHPPGEGPGDEPGRDGVARTSHQGIGAPFLGQ